MDLGLRKTPSQGIFQSIYPTRKSRQLGLRLKLTRKSFLCKRQTSGKGLPVSCQDPKTMCKRRLTSAQRVNWVVLMQESMTTMETQAQSTWHQGHKSQSSVTISEKLLCIPSHRSILTVNTISQTGLPQSNLSPARLRIKISKLRLGDRGLNLQSITLRLTKRLRMSSGRRKHRKLGTSTQPWTLSLKRTCWRLLPRKVSTAKKTQLSRRRNHQASLVNLPNSILRRCHQWWMRST